MKPAEFEFATAGQIIFGCGRAGRLTSLASRMGSRAFVCTGAGPSRHSDLLDDLGVSFVTFPVCGEPTIELVRAAAAAAREESADIVVAVGGGSVIDLGKAVAMLLVNGGDPLDYLEIVGARRPIAQPSLPCIAVPTTAGTGSEVTSNAVLASPEHECKASLRSPFILPAVALVDPLLTVSCPKNVTASSGLDALTQCLEPFVSVTGTILTDSLTREGLRRASCGLRGSYSDGQDVPARTDMALCSLLGGLALANAKAGVVHGLAGVIGGTVDIPHGAACAALLVASVEANVRALRLRQPGSPALTRYEEAAQLLTGCASATIEDGIVWLAETVTLLGIGKLSAYGLRPAQIDKIIASAVQASSTKGNPIVLHTDELYAILQASL